MIKIMSYKPPSKVELARDKLHERKLAKQEEQFWDDRYRARARRRRQQ